jgi:hypothetical protein
MRVFHERVGQRGDALEHVRHNTQSHQGVQYFRACSIMWYIERTCLCVSVRLSWSGEDYSGPGPNSSREMI